MSKSGVFAHFGSREELQISVVREYHDALRGRSVLPGDAASRAACRGCARCSTAGCSASRSRSTRAASTSAARSSSTTGPGPVRDALAQMVQTWHGALERAIRIADRRRPPARRHRPAADAVRDPRPDPGAAPRRALPALPGALDRAHGVRTRFAPPARRCATPARAGAPTRRRTRTPRQDRAAAAARAADSAPISFHQEPLHAALHPAAARHAVRAARGAQRRRAN